MSTPLDMVLIYAILQYLDKETVMPLHQSGLCMPMCMWTPDMKQRALMYYIKMGNLQKVMDLHAVGTDIMGKSPYRVYEMSYETSWDGEMVCYDSPSEPILFAAQQGHVDIVEYLMGCGAVLSDDDVDVVVNRASLEGHHAMVKFLVKRGASVRTVLEGAIRGGHLSLVKWAIKKGADPNEQLFGGGHMRFTPLPYAFDAGMSYRPKIVRYLIKKGANVNEAGVMASVTSLKQALILQRRGADFTLHGSTFLEEKLSSFQPDAELIDWLFSIGCTADTAVINAAMGSAVEELHFDLIKILITHGASIGNMRKLMKDRLTCEEKRLHSLIRYHSDNMEGPLYQYGWLDVATNIKNMIELLHETRAH